MALFRRQQKTDEMPKNILEALQPTQIDQPKQVLESEDTPVNPPEPEETKIPDYLVSDPEVVGYTDSESQNQFYQWAINNLKITENTIILDQGCGRGDLLDIIPGVQKYIGIDSNPIMKQISETKYPNYDFQTINWLDYNNPEVDWALNIFGTLKPNYDAQQNLIDKYQILKDTIDRTLSYVKSGFVLLALADNGGVEEYQHFELSKIVEMIKPYSYVLDRSVSSTVFKVTFYKQ